jgi:hypothetical protein
MKFDDANATAQTLIFNAYIGELKTTSDATEATFANQPTSGSLEFQLYQTTGSELKLENLGLIIEGKIASQNENMESSVDAPLTLIGDELLTAVKELLRGTVASASVSSESKTNGHYNSINFSTPYPHDNLIDVAISQREEVAQAGTHNAFPISIDAYKRAVKTLVAAMKDAPEIADLLETDPHQEYWNQLHSQDLNVGV